MGCHRFVDVAGLLDSATGEALSLAAALARGGAEYTLVVAGSGS